MKKLVIIITFILYTLLLVNTNTELLKMNVHTTLLTKRVNWTHNINYTKY